MNRKIRLNLERRQLLFFLGTVFVIYFLWSVFLPVNAAPDEAMRFQIPNYIYRNGSLPAGYDPQIRDANWGFSYAFLPYLAGLFSSFFMKVASIFSTAPEVLFAAARFTSVVCGTLTAFFCYKLGTELFDGMYRWVFVSLIVFLPQFAFCASYHNNESLALMSISMILYCWVRGIRYGWPVKICVLFGIALSICFLSYYNAYGFILCSALIFIISAAFQGEGKIHWKPLFGKGFFIVGVVLVLAGWWFIRNCFLYDGDFLGRAALNICGEQYAIESLKPSVRETLKSQGYSLLGMLKNTAWIQISYQSFIGVFGWMDVWMSGWIYSAFLALFGLAGVGLLLKIKKFWQRRKTAFKEGGAALRGRLLFEAALLLGMGITLGLSLHYSYTSDFQPQGRYLLPMLIPLMYFVTMGLRALFQKLTAVLKRPSLERALACAVLVFMLLALGFALATAVVPAYC